MRLTKANKKAIEHACKYFHYAKKVPSTGIGYNVYNDKNEWCGVILYGKGASPNIADPFGMKQGEVLELLRVALNGKQEQTSKAVSISLRLLKKDAPMCNIVVSYADSREGHKGIIYRATNWYYFGDSYTEVYIDKKTGKQVHSKTVNTRFLGKENRKFIPIYYDKAKEMPKLKYVMPMKEQYRAMCKERAKPFPN